jgi:DNA-binding PadR family transcriptional regulator
MGPSDSLGDFEQLVLLALLRLGPDTYGAEVRREIEARTGRELSMSATHTTLDRLEAKGLVRSRIGEPTPQRGGRRRKHFVLLAAGRTALSRSYHTFRGMVDGLEAELERR